MIHHVDSDTLVGILKKDEGADLTPGQMFVLGGQDAFNQRQVLLRSQLNAIFHISRFFLPKDDLFFSCFNFISFIHISYSIFLIFSLLFFSSLTPQAAETASASALATGGPVDSSLEVDEEDDIVIEEPPKEAEDETVVDVVAAEGLVGVVEVVAMNGDGVQVGQSVGEKRGREEEAGASSKMAKI